LTNFSSHKLGGWRFYLVFYRRLFAPGGQFCTQGDFPMNETQLFTFVILPIAVAALGWLAARADRYFRTHGH
jgi:hypothetical protein